MTGFIIACAAMVAAALLWILLPLLRTKSPDAGASRKERLVSAIAIALVVPALAATLYVTLSKWNWSETGAAMAREQQMDDLLGQLKAKLAENPNYVNGWHEYALLELERAQSDPSRREEYLARSRRLQETAERAADDYDRAKVKRTFERALAEYEATVGTV